MDGVDPSSPVPGMGHDAGSKVASMFYQTILDSKVFWDNTMEFEGTTKFTLPRSNGEQLNVCVQARITQIAGRSRDGRDAPRAPDVAPPCARPDHPPKLLVSCHDVSALHSSNWMPAILLRAGSQSTECCRMYTEAQRHGTPT